MYPVCIQRTACLSEAITCSYSEVEEKKRYIELKHPSAVQVDKLSSLRVKMGSKGFGVYSLSYLTGYKTLDLVIHIVFTFQKCLILSNFANWRRRHQREILTHCHKQQWAQAPLIWLPLLIREDHDLMAYKTLDIIIYTVFYVFQISLTFSNSANW